MEKRSYNSALAYLRKGSQIFTPIILAIFTLFGFLRLYGSLALWNYLTEIGLRNSTLYLSITGFIWGITGITGLFVYIRKRKWAMNYMRILSLVFSAWFWLDMEIFQPQGEQIRNRLFLLILNILILGMIFGSSVLLRYEYSVIKKNIANTTTGEKHA